jgi:NitT/TauT family transport system substrate-binding protein
MVIMVHKSRKLKGLSDLFSQEGIVALEQGQAYVSYLKKKFEPIKAKFVPYTGGVSSFLHDPQFAQQGYIFSEPLTAKAQGADPDFFLLASAGYNPYSAVVAVRAEYLKQNEALVKSMVTAIRDGWASYRKSPQEANQKMASLNKAMDLATFAAAAKEQERLLGDGSMSESRWKEHIQQLLDAKALTKAPDAQACFRNF